MTETRPIQKPLFRTRPLYGYEFHSIIHGWCISAQEATHDRSEAEREKTILEKNGMPYRIVEVDVE